MHLWLANKYLLLIWSNHLISEGLIFLGTLLKITAHDYTLEESDPIPLSTALKCVIISHQKNSVQYKETSCSQIFWHHQSGGYQICTSALVPHISPLSNAFGWHVQLNILRKIIVVFQLILLPYYEIQQRDIEPLEDHWSKFQHSLKRCWSSEFTRLSYTHIQIRSSQWLVMNCTVVARLSSISALMSRKTNTISLQVIQT